MPFFSKQNEILTNNIWFFLLFENNLFETLILNKAINSLLSLFPPGQVTDFLLVFPF